MADSLIYKRGDTWKPIFYLADASGNPINLTGSTARAQLREKRGDALLFSVSSEATVEVPVPGLTITPADGKVEAVIEPETTRLIDKGTYKLDLEITYADGTVQTYPEVEDIIVMVKADVTYGE